MFSSPQGHELTNSRVVISQIVLPYRSGTHEPTSGHFPPRSLVFRIRGNSIPYHSYNHHAEHYEKALKKARPGDTLLLLYALDHHDRALPEKYADLRIVPDVLDKLKAGKTVEQTGKVVQGV